jgi:hypothetical protein
VQTADGSIGFPQGSAVHPALQLLPLPPRDPGPSSADRRVLQLRLGSE